ncbi:MAG: hypothetical protein R3247_15520 [Rhodothermales bacterium]|nr:hypothetical protein [Rhodothermales bacterium]
MTLPRTPLSLFRDETGSTLLEAVVATALLVAVLLPVSASAVHLLTMRKNEPHLLALALGEQVMEETLHRRAYASGTFDYGAGRWTVRKTIRLTRDRVTIRVRVFRRHRPDPLVDLMTVRIRS